MRGSSLGSLRQIVEVLGAANCRLPRDEEEKFFSFLRLHNRTAKVTYAHRLDEVNQLAATLLPSWRPLQVLDVGVSSGVSTLEWIESLEHSGITFHMTAVDIMVEGILIDFGHGVELLADRRGRMLVLNLRGRWISNPPGKRNLLRYFAAIWGFKLWLRRRWPRVVSSMEGRYASRRFSTCRFPLLYSALRNHPCVSVEEADILSEAAPPARAHVIRAANILNRSYFSEAQLSTMVRNLRAKLPPGGLLIVCRTQEDSGVTAGTVFRLNDAGRFEAAARIHGGSEIQDLVLKLQPAAGSHGKYASRVES